MGTACDTRFPVNALTLIVQSICSRTKTPIIYAREDKAPRVLQSGAIRGGQLRLPNGVTRAAGAAAPDMRPIGRRNQRPKPPAVARHMGRNAGLDGPGAGR